MSQTPHLRSANFWKLLLKGLWAQQVILVDATTAESTV